MTRTAPTRTVAPPFPGMPRWVKLAAIIAIAIALVLVVVVILITGVHTPPPHGP